MLLTATTILLRGRSQNFGRPHPSKHKPFTPSSQGPLPEVMAPHSRGSRDEAAVARGIIPRLQKHPQMVSPHSTSLQQPVTYTRASCEISELGGGGGADKNAHSRCGSALTSAPAALLAAGAAKSSPSLLPPLTGTRSHALAVQAGQGGDRVLLLPQHPASRAGRRLMGAL